MTLTQEEIWTFNILNAAATTAQAELQRVVVARNNYIKEREEKYSANFDAATGEFIPRKDNHQLQDDRIEEFLRQNT